MLSLQYLILASAFALSACLGSLNTVQAGDAPETKTVSTITGKERLGRKWSDEQRVDDCRVPEEYRTKERPRDCPERSTVSVTAQEKEPKPVSGN